MDKLELKHLAPYLPYGLKIKTPTRIAILGFKYDEHFITIPNIIKNGEHDKDFQPILRPLSDKLGESAISYMDQHRLTYQDWETLFENHMDVFGLIEKGLAIDINTL